MSFEVTVDLLISLHVALNFGDPEFSIGLELLLPASPVVTMPKFGIDKHRKFQTNNRNIRISVHTPNMDSVTHPPFPKCTSKSQLYLGVFTPDCLHVSIHSGSARFWPKAYPRLQVTSVTCTLAVSFRATTFCVLGLRAGVELAKQQGLVARWLSGVDAQQDRAEPVAGVDAVGMVRGKERAVHGDVLGSGVLSGQDPAPHGVSYSNQTSSAPMYVFCWEE
jgi:hypothetical protein